MPDESLEGLHLQQESIIVDATFGGGGHSRLILQRLGRGRIFAFDQDEDAAGNRINDDRLFFIRHNFRYLKFFLRFYNVDQVDGVFADLGVSSHDFDVPERGFSFRFEGDLDMRMNQNSKKDAAMVLNTYSEEQLISVFRIYGEIKNAGLLASKIIKCRLNNPLKTTNELKEIALQCARKGAENKYLAQVFQAIRIEVNEELEALKEFFFASLDVLKTKGRLVVITYHSLEDRLCKNFMKTGNFDGKMEKDFYGNPITPFKIINRKVIVPSAEEVKKNTRARSAKLRIAEKI
jgi:16S rRNA (cytosine1402-N4)-methyltransferase